MRSTTWGCSWVAPWDGLQADQGNNDKKSQGATDQEVGLPCNGAVNEVVPWLHLTSWGLTLGGQHLQHQHLIALSLVWLEKRATLISCAEEEAGRRENQIGLGEQPVKMVLTVPVLLITVPNYRFDQVPLGSYVLSVQLGLDRGCMVLSGVDMD